MGKSEGASASPYLPPNPSAPLTYFQCPEWLQAIKDKAGEWQDRPLTVLSLFDGIGATWAALDMLGILCTGYSSEVDPGAIQIVASKWPLVTHLGDITKITTQTFTQKGTTPHFDLIVGGCPCQDLSAMNKHRIGLHGPRSCLFFDMVRLIHQTKPKWFLVENVSSMLWEDKEEMTKHLGVRPLEIDCSHLTPQKRSRFFWTNLDLPTSIPKYESHISTDLQSVLTDAVAQQSKTGVSGRDSKWSKWCYM